jgi:hypothetical protein
MAKNVIELEEYGQLSLDQQHISFRGDDFDANIHVKILHTEDIDHTPTIRETVENLDLISQVTQQPIDRVTVVAPTTENLSHYQELVEALSNKYKVNVHLGMICVAGLMIIVHILQVLLHFLPYWAL